MTRHELEQFFDDLLSPGGFQDYGPNGLQVEGAARISKIAFAVSATVDSIAAASAANADALIVHHGLFWNFHGPKTITGSFKRRIFPLIQNSINLFGYHLPLDAHLEVGNAASLAKLIGVSKSYPFGDFKGSPTGVKGNFETPVSALDLREKLCSVLNHSVMLASLDPDQIIRSVGIITGGANSEWVFAKQDELDAYITGEMSEHDWHDSREAGIHMFAGGHHATERFGIQALMKRVHSKFDIDVVFIDSENPA